MKTPEGRQVAMEPWEQRQTRNAGMISSEFWFVGKNSNVWASDECHVICAVQYGGQYKSTDGFQQAECQWKHQKRQQHWLLVWPGSRWWIGDDDWWRRKFLSTCWSRDWNNRNWRCFFEIAVKGKTSVSLPESIDGLARKSEIKLLGVTVDEDPCSERVRDCTSLEFVNTTTTH